MMCVLSPREDEIVQVCDPIPWSETVCCIWMWLSDLKHSVTFLTNKQVALSYVIIFFVRPIPIVYYNPLIPSVMCFLYQSLCQWLLCSSLVV